MQNTKAVRSRTSALRPAHSYPADPPLAPYGSVTQLRSQNNGWPASPKLRTADGLERLGYAAGFAQ